MFYRYSSYTILWNAPFSIPHCSETPEEKYIYSIFGRHPFTIQESPKRPKLQIGSQIKKKNPQNNFE